MSLEDKATINMILGFLKLAMMLFVVLVVIWFGKRLNVRLAREDRILNLAEDLMNLAGDRKKVAEGVVTQKTEEVKEAIKQVPDLTVDKIKEALPETITPKKD